MGPLNLSGLSHGDGTGTALVRSLGVDTTIADLLQPFMENMHNRLAWDNGAGLQRQHNGVSVNSVLQHALRTEDHALNGLKQRKAQ